MPVIIVILVAVILAMGAGIVHLKDDLKLSDRRLVQSTQHLDSKGGGTMLLTGEWINYNLKSYDNGKHWYAIEYDDDWGIVIIGESEEIYPGLLEHLEAMDRLTSHINANGPITSESDLDLLRDVGFGVEVK